MASYVTIELDTRPPHLTFTQVERTPDELIATYAIDEPEVVAAVFRPAGGGPDRGMVVEPDRLVLPDQGPALVAGAIRATVRDAVDNEALFIAPYVAPWPETPAGDLQRPPSRGRVSGLLEGGSVSSTGGRIAEGEGGRAL